MNSLIVYLLCFANTYFLKCTMSSFKIVNEVGQFPYVMFGGSYKCSVPSVVEAMSATEVEIEGIAGVTRRQYGTRIYPRGRFCCGKCGEWKQLDDTNWAWAVRSAYGTCPLVCEKLVCENCVAQDDAFTVGCRFATLVHEDFYWSMRADAKRTRERFLVKKWQEVVRRRKERREFALKSALVFKETFDNRLEGWQQVWSAFMAHT